MTVDQLKGKTVGAAVSGGLDSCTITRWLVDNGVNVVCFTADLGQPDEKNMDEICERMLACGAQEAVIVDARDELAMAGIKVLQSQAKYEGGYWNTTGIARHITVEALCLKWRNVALMYWDMGVPVEVTIRCGFKLQPIC